MIQERDRILFLTGGAREATLERILAENFNVVSLLTPIPSESNNRFVEVIDLAKKYPNIEILSCTRENVTEVLKNIDFDVMLSCGFSYLLDEEAIAEAKKIAINVHPTLLPQYRGYRSGPYIIINDEKESGVTVHLLQKEMDKGPILGQVRFPLTPFDTPQSLSRKTAEAEASLVVEVLHQIEQNEAQFHDQDEANSSTYNYIRKPIDSEVDARKPLFDLYNEIRACDPIKYPAFFYINGEKVCIKLWRPDKPESESDTI